jgi:hypothetical protein
MECECIDPRILFQVFYFKDASEFDMSLLTKRYRILTRIYHPDAHCALFDSLWNEIDVSKTSLFTTLDMTRDLLDIQDIVTCLSLFSTDSDAPALFEDILYKHGNTTLTDEFWTSVKVLIDIHTTQFFASTLYDFAEPYADPKLKDILFKIQKSPSSSNTLIQHSLILAQCKVARKKANIEKRIQLSWKDLYFGKKISVSYPRSVVCTHCRGRRIENTIADVFCKTCGGCGWNISSDEQCATCSGTGCICGDYPLCSACNGTGRVQKEREICITVRPGSSWDDCKKHLGKGNAGYISPAVLRGVTLTSSVYPSCTYGDLYVYFDQYLEETIPDEPILEKPTDETDSRALVKPEIRILQSEMNRIGSHIVVTKTIPLAYLMQGSIGICTHPSGKTYRFRVNQLGKDIFAGRIVLYATQMGMPCTPAEQWNRRQEKDSSRDTPPNEEPDTYGWMVLDITVAYPSVPESPICIPEDSVATECICTLLETIPTWMCKK